MRRQVEAFLVGITSCAPHSRGEDVTGSPGLRERRRPTQSRLASLALTLSAGVASVAGLFLPASAWADGTELLGPPGITIEQGTGTVLAGTGMLTQPGTIDISVPGDVVQVLLYWEGFMTEEVAGDDTITVSDGASTQSITGTLVGGPAPFGEDNSSVYRADITESELVRPGINTLTLSDLVYTRAANGAGVLVIYDDGSGVFDIDLVDGVDTAFVRFSEPNKSTVAQSFSFEPADSDRTANLGMFFSSVQGTASGGGPLRPSSVEVNVGDTTQVFSNLLDSVDGEEWDTTNITVDIPAGAGSLTVQAFSRDDLGDGRNPSPASFTWLAAALAVTPAPAPGIEIKKEISIDGGNTFFDANDEDSAVKAVAPADALYLFTVTNTGNVALQNVTIDDESLGIFDVAIGTLDIGEVRFIDGDTDGFFELDKLPRCEEPGVFVNIATVTGESESGSRFTDSDPAVLICFGTPAIDITKEISVDGGLTYADANTEDTAPSIPAPGGALYRLTVTNVGTAPLVNVLISDDVLGISEVPIASLGVGDVAILDSGSAGFEQLAQPERCPQPGSFTNIAKAVGESADTGDVVMDVDPAVLVCTMPVDPEITLKKEVSVDGGSTFFDANDKASAPVAPFPSDAEYQLVVENTGDVALEDVIINDATLGLVDVAVGALAVDEIRIIGAADAGFNVLVQPDRCTAAGTFANVAEVTGKSVDTDQTVSDSDPALIICVGTPAIDLRKEISVDGGANFADANDEATAAKATAPADAVYRFVVSNVGTAPLEAVTITDETLDIVDMPVDGLEVGATVIIASGNTGFANLDQPGRCPNPGTFVNVATVKGASAETGEGVTDSDPATLVCEAAQCELSVHKTCEVVLPPSGDLACDAKIAATTLRYTGPSVSGATVVFTGKAKNTGSVTYENVDLTAGVILSAASQNDLTIDARPSDLGSKLSIAINGHVEVIHTSCSAPYVAGKPAPLNHPKGAPSPNWEVVSFVDKNGTSVAVPEPVGPAESCEAVLGNLPSCDTVAKPHKLTWRYDGGSDGSGDCASSTFPDAVNAKGKTHRDFKCSGAVDVAAALTVRSEKGDAITVNPGEEFSVSRDAIKRLALHNAGGSQHLRFHTSCSQPLEAGRTAGALTLVALDGERADVGVNYAYTVRNTGTVEALNVALSDDQFDVPGSAIGSLGIGESVMLKATSFITGTTTNIATVTGHSASGASCSATDAVTVTIVEPPHSRAVLRRRKAEEAGVRVHRAVLRSAAPRGSGHELAGRQVRVPRRSTRRRAGQHPVLKDAKKISAHPSRGIEVGDLVSPRRQKVRVRDRSRHSIEADMLFRA